MDTTLQTLDALLKDGTARYIANPSSLLDDLFEKLNHTDNESVFTSLHSSFPTSGLGRGRFMIQDGAEPEYFNPFYTAKEGDNSFLTTLFLRDEFSESLEVEAAADTTLISRHCFNVVDVPGASDWFIEDFELGSAPAKRTRGDGPVQPLGFTAKFYGESAEDLKPNTIVDIYGYFNEQSGNDGAKKVLHVIKYEVLKAADSAKEDELPQSDMVCVRDVLQKNLEALLGDTSTASFVLVNLSSSTYARPGGMPICSIPVNILGVSNSESIINFFKIIMPKVKVLELTPELLSNTPFASVKNYDSDKLIQGELQLANGTLVVIDETKLPDGPFSVSGYVETNLKTLEQLILEQRIHYDYGFYKIPFDVDYPIVILSKKQSRILKTPFTVPFIPSVGIVEVPSLRDSAGQNVARQYLQLVRRNLPKIGITAETTKMINENFVEIAKNLDRHVDKADFLNELLILSRILAASEGNALVTYAHWTTALAMERARKEALRMFQEM